MNFRLSIFTATCGILFSSFACANSDMRQWQLTAQREVKAEIVSFDEEKGAVVLRTEDKTLLNFAHADFTTSEQAWLLEWLEYKEEKEAMVAKLGGKIDRHTGTGKYTTEYSVYHPSGSAPATKLPLMILFHPGGNGHRDILRYVEAAEAVKMTLVSCETFQNSGDNPKIEDEYLKRFRELLPQIEETVPHDPAKIFMGGNSGGGWRSYHYSAQVERPWAGIYSNCGWLGDEKYLGLPYPKMRVTMVNGDKDYGRWTMDRDTKILVGRGAEVSIVAFEGGHQVAPPSVMTKAFRWLLGEVR